MTGSGELDPALVVDWLSPDDLRDDRPGRLGMTSLPGKHGASLRYPGLVYRRDLDVDLDRLVELGVRRLLLLVDDRELERWGDVSIVERGAARGLAVVRRPLPDGAAPASAEEMDEMLGLLAAGRSREDVAVACMGGVGRTGLVAASALVAAGWPGPEAIARVRAVRHPQAVETQAQLAFLEAYERHLAARGRSRRVNP